MNIAGVEFFVLKWTVLPQLRTFLVVNSFALVSYGTLSYM